MTETRRAGLRPIAGDMAEVYRRGGRAMRAAPWLAAIAILPEAAQHAVEIGLGMFDSRAAFQALAQAPLRWGFGYVKVAGVLLATLAMARFHATGSQRRALLPPARTLGRVVALVAVLILTSMACTWLGARSGTAGWIGFGLLSLVAQSGLMLMIVGALIEDGPTWRGAFGAYLPSGLLLTLYMALAFVPAQLLHMANHRLALGRAAPLVWGLMAFDAVWIGLLVSLLGAAVFVGGRARLTWRGWRA